MRCADAPTLGACAAACDTCAAALPSCKGIGLQQLVAALSMLVWLLQVPVRIFVTQQLPKTATGKIQRRMMVEHFIKGPGQKEEAGASGKPSQPRSKL